MEEVQETDIMEYVKMLLKKWKFLLLWGFVSAVVAVVLVIDIPKTYTSSTVLAPELRQKSNALSSLAAMAGVNVNAPTEAMYPDIYPEIVESAPFLANILALPVDVEQGGDEEIKDLYGYLMHGQRSPWWSAVLAAPGRAIGWVIGLFVNDDDAAMQGTESDGDEMDPLHPNREQSALLGALRSRINIEVDKKTFLINISVSMQDPVIAKQVCDKVVSDLSAFVTDYYTEKARVDVEYFEKLNEQYREEYYEAQRKLARYVDSNQGISRQSVRIEGERLQNEANLAYSLYNQTSSQLQMSKAKVQQETPVCTVLKPATVPLKGGPSKIKHMIIIVFLLECIAAGWVIYGERIKEFIKEIK